MKLLLAALLLTGCAVPQPKPLPNPADVAHRIETESSVCSATAVAPNVLLTASHCLPEDLKLLIVNGTAASVMNVEHDGSDHSLVTVTATFPAYAKRGPAMKVGDAVQYTGNPGQFSGLYRRGYVASVQADLTIIDCNCWHGDSGAGLLNDKGELVGMVSGISKGEFRVMAAFPFKFKAWPV